MRLRSRPGLHPLFHPVRPPFRLSLPVLAAVLCGSAFFGFSARAQQYNPFTGGTQHQDASSLIVQPSSIDFGQVDLSDGSGVSRQILLRNETAGALHLRIPEPADTSLSISGCPDLLEKDAACALRITWNPALPTTLKTAILVGSRERGDQPVEVSGHATGQPGLLPKGSSVGGALVASQGAIDLGGTGGSSGIMLVDNGVSPVSVSSISLAGQSHLALSGDCLQRDAPLIPGQACAVVVSWDGLEPVRDMLVIRHSGLRGVLLVPVHSGARLETAGRAASSLPPLPPPPETASRGDAEGHGSSRTPAPSPSPSAVPLSAAPTLMAISGASALVSVSGATLTLSPGHPAGGWSLSAVDATCATITPSGDAGGTGAGHEHGPGGHGSKGVTLCLK